MRSDIGRAIAFEGEARIRKFEDLIDRRTYEATLECRNRPLGGSIKRSLLRILDYREHGAAIAI
jgi:hypothetical protein